MIHVETWSRKRAPSIRRITRACVPVCVFRHLAIGKRADLVICYGESESYSFVIRKLQYYNISERISAWISYFLQGQQAVVVVEPNQAIDLWGLASKSTLR